MMLRREVAGFWLMNVWLDVAGTILYDAVKGRSKLSS